MASLPVPINDDRGMTDSELASLCAGHEAKAIGYFTSDIAAEQAKAINYYYGIMDDVPVLDGCSGVRDFSVAIMVDNGLASVLKPFVSADDMVSFTGRGPEDEQQAEQATEFVNYVINCDNPGFLIFHNWFKDALLTKLGIVKVWWEDQSTTGEYEQPADAESLLSLRGDDNYLREREVGDGLYAVHMQRHNPDGRVKIEGIPPEEFLISPFARTLETAPYVAHKPKSFTRSDLVEFGVDPEIVEGLPAGASHTNEESRSQARYRDEQYGANSPSNDHGSDKSQDILDIIDEYVRVDFDGDGISELRRIVRVGDVILMNEVVDEAPFATLCPVPMPHKVYGQSTADQAIEGQRVSTAIIRQTLDNLYKSNNPRPEVPDGAVNENTWDDIGDTSPGAAIRTKQGGLLDWQVVPFAADKSFSMLEYVALGIEERCGVQRKGNGLNPETLKKNSPDTATQATLDENSRNERAEMVARIFAETGVKRLFKLILKLLVAHQPKERMIRLRNKWVEVDPRGWNPDMDLEIAVGLGVGNKAEEIGQADSVLATMAELQDTKFAYLIDAKKVHKALARKFTAVGIKNVDDYLVDPDTAEPPEPQPSPEMAKVQAQIEGDKAKTQMAGEKAAIELQQARAEGAAKIDLMREEAAAKLELDRARSIEEANLAREKFAFEAELAREKMALDAELAREQAARDHEHRMKEADAKISANRAGGDLAK